MMHGYRQQEPYWYNPQRSYSAHNHPTYRKRRSSRQRKPSKYKVIYEEDVFPDHPQVYPYDTSQPYRGPDQVSWLDPVSPYMMQSTGPPWPPHLNQPVITFDPMMMHFYPPQHLDTRATELLYPAHVLYDQAQRLPMMQPYFMPTGLPPNLASHFLDPMPFMDVASSKVDEPPSPDSQEKLEEVRPKSMAPSTSPIEPPQPLRRRLSLMESLLDSFSLLNEPKVMSQTSYQEMDPSTSESSGSNDEVKEEPKLIDRRPSLSRKLSKKANALQSRQFIWCYRLRDTEGALWTAFDVKNQSTLDKQYALLVSKKQQQQQNSDGSLNDEDISVLDKGVVINKQSQVSGQLMVSLSTGTAWCYSNSSFSFGSDHAVVYDVASLPSQLNRLVVPDKDRSDVSVKRSKSFDGFASKLLNTVLKR